MNGEDPALGALNAVSIGGLVGCLVAVAAVLLVRAFRK